VPEAVKNSDRAEKENLFRLTADVFPNQVNEAPLGSLAELIVATGLFADHKPAAMIAGVEPLRAWNRGTVGAIESHPRPQFDEGAALRKVCWVLELNAH